MPLRVRSNNPHIASSLCSLPGFSCEACRDRADGGDLQLVLVVGCVTAAVWHMGQAGTNSMVVQLASSLNISVPELYELGGTLPAGAPATLASESAVAAPDGQQDDAAAPPADRGMAPAPASPAKKAKTSSTLSAEDVLVKAERLGMVSEKSAKQASSGKDAKEGEAKRSAAALQREAERAAARRATREAERAAAEGATAAAEEQPQKEEVATGGEEKGRADRRRSAPSKEEAEGVVAEKEAPKEAPKEKAGGSEEKTRKPQAEAVVERAQAAQQRSKERRERAKAEGEKKEEKETGQTPVVKQPVVKRSAAALQREAERAALRRSEREQKDRAEEATAEDVED